MIKNEFERELEQSINYYEAQGLLMGEKVQEKRRFFTNISFGKSRYDFFILKNGIYFALEAKFRNNVERFPLSALTDRQRYELLNVVSHGGEGLVIIRFLVCKVRYCYAANICDVIEMKSVTLDECKEDKKWIHFPFKDYKYDILKGLDDIIS